MKCLYGGVFSNEALITVKWSLWFRIKRVILLIACCCQEAGAICEDWLHNQGGLYPYRVLFWHVERPKDNDQWILSYVRGVSSTPIPLSS